MNLINGVAVGHLVRAGEIENHPHWDGYFLPVTKEMLEHLGLPEFSASRELLAIKFDSGKHGKFIGFGKCDFELKVD